MQEIVAEEWQWLGKLITHFLMWPELLFDYNIYVFWLIFLEFDTFKINYVPTLYCILFPSLPFSQENQ